MPSVRNDSSKDGMRQILSLQLTYGGKPWGFLNLNALLPLSILELRISFLRSMGPLSDVHFDPFGREIAIQLYEISKRFISKIRISTTLKIDGSRSPAGER